MTANTFTVDHLIGKSVWVRRTIAESDVYLFGGVTGDLAAYHTDELTMAGTALRGRIAHGVLILGFASAASSKFWDTYGAQGRSISYGYDRVRFVRPAYIGSTITTSYELCAYDPQSRKADSRVLATDEGGQVVLSATHITKVGDL